MTRPGISEHGIACFATQGSGHPEEARVKALLEPLGPRVMPFDRAAKTRSCLRLIREIHRERPDLVVMEGTGTAGGIAVLVGRWLFRTRYVISGGDAVAPFIGARFRPLTPLAATYERILYGSSAGYIGWTPYLVGRALTFGAPRAMTAPNWAPASEADPGARGETRSRFGIPDAALVFGLVGSLHWNRRVGYCYGLELVRALTRVRRRDIHVLIVGDGSGKDRLAGHGEGRLHLAGQVPREHLNRYLQAMDVASLPQSVDGVGSFRYTTKISEYLAAGLPIVTGQIPAAYDLDGGWLWRLPGSAPWDERYVAELAELMERLTPDELEERRARVPRKSTLFDLSRQRNQVTQFVRDLLATQVSEGG